MATEPNIKLEVLQGGAGGSDAVVAPNNERDPVIGETPGQILRAERKKQGLKQLDICDRLRLQPWVVEALEEDEYHRLAAPTYARGYLRNYANLLEIPEAGVLAAYELVRADKPASESNAKRMVSGSETRPVGADGPSKWAPMVGLGLLIGVIGLFAAWWFGDRGALNGSDMPGYASSADFEVSDAPELNSYVAESVPAADEPSDDGFSNGLAVADDSAVTAERAEQASAGIAAADREPGKELGQELSKERDQEAGQRFGQPASSSGLDAETLAAAQAEAAFEARQFESSTIASRSAGSVPQVEIKPEPLRFEASRSTTVDGVPLSKTYPVTDPGFRSGASATTGSSYVVPVNDGKTAISLYFQQDSWAEIRDANGSKLVYRLGQAGTSADVRGFPPFRVFLGNSPGVEVQLNGSPYETRQHHRPNNTARFQVGADS